MKYSFTTKGHYNITSKHKTTFEFTKDNEMGKAADCIIGVSSKVNLADIPQKLRNAIKDDKSIITIQLETENAADEIKGYGHPDLTLDHPTDMVCRKSEYKCSRTLMIKADKAAVDIKKELIEDLKEGKDLKVTISVE